MNPFVQTKRDVHFERKHILLPPDGQPLNLNAKNVSLQPDEQARKDISGYERRGG
jgi:hypothetical protein